jgi:hypothetical protein
MNMLLATILVPEAHMKPAKDDRIFRSTRVVAALVVPFLVTAFVILFFTPQTSADRFAWAIQPSMTAAFMGAGYLGGSWLFIQTVFGRQWHRVAPGFPAVTAFTIAMLLATVVHWDRFDPGHLPFLIWLVLYVITPVLIPVIWWRNRVTDPHVLEPGDLEVLPAARWGLGVLGAGLLAFAVITFIIPTVAIDLWPWALSPLTARILAGWFALLGVGGLVIARESRWSGWTVGLQAIAIWHILVLAAAAIYRADFPGGLLNWYILSVAAVLMGMALLYATMERRRRALPASWRG